MGLHLGYHILKIHLGFEDFKYEERHTVQSPLSARTRARLAKKPSPEQQAYGAGETTKSVADRLEAEYSVVETFYDQPNIQDFIVNLLEDALYDITEVVMQSDHPPTVPIPIKDIDKIEERFRRALSGMELEGQTSPGSTPTQTALKGVSHLFTNPYKQRGRRPSFIDTGMYRQSFRAWVED